MTVKKPGLNFTIPLVKHSQLLKWTISNSTDTVNNHVTWEQITLLIGQ